jgi:signal transduction histidine kinase
MKSAPKQTTTAAQSSLDNPAYLQAGKRARLQRRLIVAGFSIATAVLVALLCLAYWSNTRFVQWNALVMHTREVQGALENYTSAMKNAQLAAVNFYTDGNEQQVAAFAAAQAQAHKALDRVRELTPDNPTQQHNLDVLIPLSDQGKNLLGQLFPLRRAGKTGPEGMAEVNAEAKKISPPLGAALTAMITEENHLLETRSAAVALFGRRARMQQLFGGALAIALVAAIVVMYFRESSMRTAAERDLAKINTELEQRIIERTEALEAAVSQALRENESRLGAEAAVRSLNAELEQRVRMRTSELENANRELEAFCYSVSHDLRAPLRGIDGFTQALLEDLGDKMDAKSRAHLERVRAAATRMGTLIDDLLNLSRITRGEMRKEAVDVSQLAESVNQELQESQPGRRVDFIVAQGLRTQADSKLLRILLQNLLSNSWKFTSKRADARIEIGRTDENGSSSFYVADNGAGFDPAYSDRLFGAFQRLHGTSEFPGTGVGLATVQRIVHRHGGTIWAKGEVDRGATFYFTLQPAIHGGDPAC